MSLNGTQEGRASSIGDWEGYYGDRGGGDRYVSVNPNDFRNFSHRILLEKVKEYYQGGSIIEIGAGDSSALIDISRLLSPTECWGLDYVKSACDRLSAKASGADVKINVVCADMFAPPPEMQGRFDYAFSLGVVEHFHDLPAVVGAISGFVRDGGTIFTLIPNNKNTIYGYLMRRWNIDVYNAHVLYGKAELEDAHRRAGVELIWSDYIVSSNFGMLSWCFSEKEAGFSFWVYKQLTRVSKLVWFLESKFGLRMTSRHLSPYIVCVGKVVR